MGLFDWFNASDDDESLIEVSNDSGDHWVASVPTDGVGDASVLLKQADVARDDDALLCRDYWASRTVASRNHQEYRFRCAPVVDPSEDLEGNGDLEDDRTKDYDAEPTEGYDESKVPQQFRWWC